MCAEGKGMGNPRVFGFSLLFNILILLYSAYQVKVNDSEFWVYTFIGVALWTVGIILVTPSNKPIKWYTVDKLLGYPLLSLIVFIVMFHASGLFDFLLKAIILSGIGGLIVYALQKKLSKGIALAYYSILVMLAWVSLHKYPLIPLAYILFVVYCALNLLHLTNRDYGGGIERAS